MRGLGKLEEEGRFIISRSIAELWKCLQRWSPMPLILLQRERLLCLSPGRRLRAQPNLLLIQSKNLYQLSQNLRYPPENFELFVIQICFKGGLCWSAFQLVVLVCRVYELLWLFQGFVCFGGVGLWIVLLVLMDWVLWDYEFLNWAF